MPFLRNSSTPNFAGLPSMVRRKRFGMCRPSSLMRKCVAKPYRPCRRCWPAYPINYVRPNFAWKRSPGGRVYRNNGTSLVLRYVPHRLRTKGLCMAAVLNQPESLQFVPEALRDAVMYEQAVSRTGHVLAMVPEEERSEHLCILAIISRTGGVLEHVPDRLKTAELCRLSCQHCGFEIASVPKDMLTPELCELAVHADCQALEALTEILFGRLTEQNACECNDSWRTR